MKLAEWLKESGQTQAMFAGSVGASQSYVAELCAGNKRPSLRIAQIIAAVTSGQVMPEDFFREDPKAAE